MIYTAFLFILYQVIHLLCLPFFIFFLLYKYLFGKRYGGSLQNRLGFVEKNSAKKNKKTIWIHASSVGEVLSIQSFVKQLREQNSHAYIYLTTSTLSGKKTATSSLNCDTVSLFPYDFLPCVYLAQKRINADVFIIVEAELWPNLLFVTRNIKSFLINARIKKRSHKKYLRLRHFYHPLFTSFQHIFVQSETDQKRFIDLGIQQKNLTIVGDMKLVNVLEKQKSKFFKKKIEPKAYTTLLAGSIHPKEDTIYLSLFTKLSQKNVSVKMILAPRHFHWKKEIKKKLQALPYRFLFIENDQISAQEIMEKLSEYDIIVVCVLGKLFELYQYADIYFLGGTFVPIGGHSIAEPCAWGVCTVVGPYHSNCEPFIDYLEKEKAVVKIETEEILREKVVELLQKKEHLRIGKSARNVLEKRYENIKVQTKKLVEVIEGNYRKNGSRLRGRNDV